MIITRYIYWKHPHVIRYFLLNGLFLVSSFLQFPLCFIDVVIKMYDYFFFVDLLFFCSLVGSFSSLSLSFVSSVSAVSSVSSDSRSSVTLGSSSTTCVTVATSSSSCSLIKRTPCVFLPVIEIPSTGIRIRTP